MSPDEIENLLDHAYTLCADDRHPAQQRIGRDLITLLGERFLLRQRLVQIKLGTRVGTPREIATAALDDTD